MVQAMRRPTAATDTTFHPACNWQTMGADALSPPVLSHTKELSKLVESEPIIACLAQPVGGLSKLQLNIEQEQEQNQHVNRLRQKFQQQEQQLLMQMQQLHRLELAEVQHAQTKALMRQHPQHHLPLQQPLLPATTAMAAAEATVAWSETVIDMPTAKFNATIAIIATTPDVNPALIDQLKLARKRKRNRQYAQRSRQRQRHSTASGPNIASHKRYAQKIATLRNFNSALRSSLELHSNP
jgi:hypothetical protein